MAAASSNTLKTELEAAVTAYKDQITFMNPTRKEYDALFFRHKKIQARYEKVIDKITSHDMTYQHHKRYFVLLSNALLASNANVRTAPRPLSDLQGLTHATLMNDFRLASHTLTAMILQNKRLDKEKDMFWNIDQKLCEKCHELYMMVDKDCQKLDQLHAEVLVVEKKMGRKPGCGVEEGKCLSCARSKAVVERAARMKKKGGNEIVGKGPKVKQRLEDIVEEGDLGDRAGEWF